jgi:hypothetical protein
MQGAGKKVEDGIREAIIFARSGDTTWERAVLERGRCKFRVEVLPRIPFAVGSGRSRRDEGREPFGYEWREPLSRPR